MSLFGPILKEGEWVPPAYGGCHCSCHSNPNVKHCVPCCYPSDEETAGAEAEEKLVELVRALRVLRADYEPSEITVEMMEAQMQKQRDVAVEVVKDSG